MSRSPTDSMRMVAIAPDVPGSVPYGMNGDFSRMSIISSPEASKSSPPDSGVAFVKGGKRKRLSKACDACHKSKRRCDGTAPCSNCYFASKECTYTDASGRPVPAPRNTHPDRAAALVDASPVNLANTTSAVGSVSRRKADVIDASSKRPRPENISPHSSMSGSIGSSPTAESGKESPLSLLDPTVTYELVNLFFTHCNPHRLIFHKPSFSAALANDKVPPYLLLAVCALAAPWSKDISSRAPMPRLAGVSFFTEASSLMFDASGRLLSEPSLATAQALCLLEMHEVAASHSWTKHYRYFDLALQLLEESLELNKPDDPILSSLSSPEARQFTTDRECTRRCFWLIQCMGWINGIYTYRPMRPRSVELMRQVRLPVDETSFELAKITQEPEFLHTPAPRTKYASQFGHVCRVLSMYQTLEAVNATKDQQSRSSGLALCREAVQAWVSSLPEHLRFSEENLDKQMAMFETGSNTGGWCYCFMHSLHPCYILSLSEAEGRLQEQPVEWIQTQLNMIFKATGNRAKNTILSACTLWTYSKYYPQDPHVQEWDDQFEKLWGFRVTLVAAQWRQTQMEQQTQIGRTYPVDGVSHRDSAPAFAVAESDSPSTSQPASVPANHSHPSSTRSSPRERHANMMDSRGRMQASAVADGNPQGSAAWHAHNQAQYTRAAAAAGVTTPRSGGGRGLQPQQSLPSLKASGLLDSWKPPTDGFGQPMSISKEDERAALMMQHSRSHSASRAAQSLYPTT